MASHSLNKVLCQAEQLCRRRGVRFTEQRRKVLEIVCSADKPLGAYEILDALRGEVQAAKPPTVYRALDFLLEQGLVHKLETLHAFVGCSHPEHPHFSQFLICSECGKIAELEDEKVARSLGDAAASTGFKPDRRVVELIGVCSHCRNAS
jgi:Fur family zinc uptake transcriptional regulator